MASSAILCVDDEMPVLQVLNEQLKRLFGNQFVYEFAQSAEEAWVVIDELKEDQIKILVIVSDWLMPGLKGDEFIKQVYQKFPEVITVLLTGQADEAAIERARQQGNLYACLHKPWKEEDLAQIVREELKNL